VSLGGVAYAAGLLAWRGGQALGLRILGWVVMVTALAIPSTPTLGLPLVALLVFALAPIPEQVTQDPQAKLTCSHELAHSAGALAGHHHAEVRTSTVGSA
jgi:hypothetical protein